MTETALNALEAANEIRRMQEFPDALRRRTSGLSLDGGFRARLRILPPGDAAFKRLLSALQEILQEPAIPSAAVETAHEAPGDPSTPNP